MARRAPLARVVGHALRAYLQAVAPSVRLVGAEAAESTWSELRRTQADRRFLLYYWTEAGLPLMLYGSREEGLLGRDLAFVHDDTLGGRVTADVLRRLGRRAWLLRHRHAGPLARDLGRLIRSSESIGIAVDGRGPYGHVGAEFARLAERCEAVSVPLGIRLTPAVRLRLAGPVQLPRAGAELTLSVGAPIDCAVDSRTLRSRLQRGLEVASSMAGTRSGVLTRAASAGA